jgi:hypothetical protein
MAASFQLSGSVPSAESVRVNFKDFCGLFNGNITFHSIRQKPYANYILSFWECKANIASNFFIK